MLGLRVFICGLGPHRQADIRALENVQRRAARYVNNDYTTHTFGCVTDMIKGLALGWESLEDWRNVARPTFFTKSRMA